MKSLPAKLSATKGKKLMPRQITKVYPLNLDGNGIPIRHRLVANIAITIANRSRTH
jgi:hypothetical protein